jgi:hypothetical protein
MRGHPTKPAGIRPMAYLRKIIRALGLGAAAPSVDNAGKRQPRTRAALQRLAARVA